MTGWHLIVQITSCQRVTWVLCSGPTCWSPRNLRAPWLRWLTWPTRPNWWKFWYTTHLMWVCLRVAFMCPYPADVGVIWHFKYQLISSLTTLAWPATFSYNVCLFVSSLLLYNDPLFCRIIILVVAQCQLWSSVVGVQCPLQSSLLLCNVLYDPPYCCAMSYTILLIVVQCPIWSSLF